MIDESITKFPLAWPAYKPRTIYYRTEHARFDKERSFATVRDELIKELNRLGAREVIISTNIPLRQDGYPYANFKRPEDMGVAVYFKKDGKSMCFSCDRWKRIEDNMYAITKTIDALRGVARWGSGDMVQAAFTGFQALPPPGPTWRDVLGYPPGVPVRREDVRHLYRKARSTAHGLGAEAFQKVESAWRQFEQEFPL